MSTGALPVRTNYVDFWAQADQVFFPPNATRNAANELNRLKQNNLPAEDFFIEFELLAARADYLDSKFDPLKMKIAEQNLQPRLVDKLYSQYEQPKDWDDFKEKVSRLDNLFQFRLRDKQQYRKALPNTNRFPSYSRPPIQKDPNAMDVDALRIRQISSPPPRNNFSPLNPNRMTGDRATLMASGACFYCKEKGHMKAQCPKLAGHQRIQGFRPLTCPNNFSTRSQSIDFLDDNSAPSSPLTQTSSMPPSDSVSTASSQDFV